MPTIVGILAFISRINYRLWNSIPSILVYLGHFGIYEQFKFYAQLAISQHYFHCMTMYTTTAITTDQKDSGSSVQRELSNPSWHAVSSVTKSELPRPIKYDLKSVID